ncbi:MAG: FAD-dependent oxidoreductase [Acidobacteriota bacterium]
MNPETRLLLIGGGHSHLEVMRRFGLERPAHIELTLVSASPRHHYSGMVPGFLRGTYSEEEISFDLAPLSAAVAARFITEAAVGLDPGARTVMLASGRSVPYDVVSFGVGSTPAGGDRAEVARHAAVVKPMSRAVELRKKLLELAQQGTSSTRQHVVVVGGGAAGVEVALAAAAVLDEAARPRQVSLVEAREQILSGYSAPFRRRAELVLASEGIAVRTGRRAVAVHADHLELEDGVTLPSGLTVWLTGGVAYPLFQDSELALDERGFLLIDDSLRSISDPRVLAAGDCGTLVNYPETPKAGVYAVRQGPLLWESLKATISGRDPPRYRPQRGFLSILNTCDGKALVRYRGIVSHSVWAWWLKDWIDRRFMKKYKALTK